MPVDRLIFGTTNPLVAWLTTHRLNKARRFQSSIGLLGPDEHTWKLVTPIHFLKFER
jgi:hypothetical protein